mgnify:CR=1 FL=1
MTTDHDSTGVDALIAEVEARAADPFYSQVQQSTGDLLRRCVAVLRTIARLQSERDAARAQAGAAKRP